MRRRVLYGREMICRACGVTAPVVDGWAACNCVDPDERDSEAERRRGQMGEREMKVRMRLPRKGERLCYIPAGHVAVPAEAVEARPLDEWHEDHGPVLWWRFPVDEEPYVGSPLDVEWPCYHTHWTTILVPALPAPEGSDHD